MENKKKKDDFVQEYLYIEDYHVEPKQVKKATDDEESERGVEIIEIF